MKLYLAGPMSGYPDFNYPAFEEARLGLEAAGHEVLCPTDSEQHNDTGKPQAWDWYMRHAVAMVLEAEGVALLPDWEASRGARLEVNVAHALSLPTAPIRAWELDYAEMHGDDFDAPEPDGSGSGS